MDGFKLLETIALELDVPVISETPPSPLGQLGGRLIVLCFLVTYNRGEFYILTTVVKCPP